MFCENHTTSDFCNGSIPKDGWVSFIFYFFLVGGLNGFIWLPQYPNIPNKYMMQVDANHQSRILILWQWEAKEETLDQEQNQIAQKGHDCLSMKHMERPK